MTSNTLESKSLPGSAPASCAEVEGETDDRAGVLDSLTEMFKAVRNTASSFASLLALESQRAGRALASIIMLALIAAGCIITAWLGLMASIVIAAVYTGVPLLVSVAVIIVLNIAAAVLLVQLGIRISDDLRFPATLRQLEGKSADKFFRL